MRALEEGNVKRSPVRPRTIIRGPVKSRQEAGQGGARSSWTEYHREE